MNELLWQFANSIWPYFIWKGKYRKHAYRFRNVCGYNYLKQWRRSESGNMWHLFVTYSFDLHAIHFAWFSCAKLIFSIYPRILLANEMKWNAMIVMWLQSQGFLFCFEQKRKTILVPITILLPIIQTKSPFTCVINFFSRWDCNLMAVPYLTWFCSSFLDSRFPLPSLTTISKMNLAKNQYSAIWFDLM